MITKTKPNPLNLVNLYGDGGEKYASGGMIIRKAKNWFVQDSFFSDAKHCAKIAGHNVKSLNFIRAKFNKLLVPLACVVDYFGIRYEVQSLCPISINSISYGSDNEGLTFTKNCPDAEILAERI